MYKYKILNIEPILIYIFIIFFGTIIFFLGILNSKLVFLLILIFLGILIVLTKLKIHKQILVFWVILLANRAFFFRTSSALENDSFDSSILMEAGITVLVTFFTFLFLMHQLLNNKFKVKHSEKFFIAYLIFTGFSLFWTPNVNYGLLWYMRLSDTILLPILYFNSKNNPNIGFYRNVFRFGHYTALGLLPYVMLAFIALFMNYGFALDLRIQSFWLHPTLASITAYSLTSYFYWVVNTKSFISKSLKKLYTYLIPICFISGFISGGKTGAFAFLIVNAYLFYKTKNLKLFKTVILVALLMLLMVILQNFFQLGLTQHLMYYNAKFEGQPLTVLHRIGLWRSVFKNILSDPFTFFFGNGFTAARFLGIKSDLIGVRSMHAHNAMINTLFESGIIGAFLLSMGILDILFKIKITGNKIFFPYTAPLLILLISSLIESVFGALLYPPAFYFYALILLLNRLKLSLNK